MTARLPVGVVLLTMGRMYWFVTRVRGAVCGRGQSAGTRGLTTLRAGADMLVSKTGLTVIRGASRTDLEVTQGASRTDLEVI